MIWTQYYLPATILIGAFNSLMLDIPITLGWISALSYFRFSHAG